MSDDFDHFVGTRPVSGKHAFDLDALSAWMERNVSGFRGPLTVEMFKGGQSNPTFKLLTPQRTTQLIGSHVVPRQRHAEIFMPPLTVREADVLALMARGLSNPEIGQRLGVSLETVRTHVKHVYMKCNARDRAQAVIAAYESGLVQLTLTGDDDARGL